MTTYVLATYEGSEVHINSFESVEERTFYLKGLLHENPTLKYSKADIDERYNERPK